MTNRTYPTPPGIPAGSRVAGIEIMADGRPQLVEGHMLTSGKVMWDRAIYSVPFNPDTMVKAEKPEPAWRQASRERAERSRVKQPGPIHSSLNGIADVFSTEGGVIVSENGVKIEE